MAFQKFYITNQGKQLLAEAQAGTGISFSCVKIGSDTLPSGADPQTRTALVMPVKSLPLKGISVNGEQAEVRVDFTNADVSEPFYWREVGLFATNRDDEEILYAYGYEDTNVDYIPTFSTGPMEFIFSMVIQVGGSANISAVVDSSLVYCTTEQAEAIAASAAAEVEESLTETINEKEVSIKAYARTEVRSYALGLSGGIANGTIKAGGPQVIGTPQIRNIYAGTADLTAGTSSLATGTIYFVYE